MIEAKPPMVHLNGTSKEHLLEVRDNAWHALAKAYDAVKSIAPNGRDYYPYGAGEFERATESHMSRLGRIQEVIDELAAELVAISEQ